jgi:hypothetical protein
VDTQTLTEALDVTGIDEAYVLQFVTMATRIYEDLEDKDSFDGFKEKLNQQSDFSAERELFLQYAESNGRMELVKYLAELGPDQVVMQWQDAKAGQELAGGADGEFENREEFAADLQTYCGYWDRTDDGWQAFVDAFQEYAESTHGAIAVDFFQRAEAGEDKLQMFEEFGVVFDDTETEAQGAEGSEFPNRAEFATDLQTYCGYWDRTDDGWQAFVDAFQEYAQGTHGAIAVDFFQRAEAGEDKHRMFEEFGVTFDDAEVTAGAGGGDGESAEDTDQMKAAGEQFGYLWAEFNGTQEGWEQSRDWTYGAANDADPTLYAAVYEKFQALEEQAMPQRIEQLNEWGFNLTATGEDNEYEGLASMFDEETIAATTDRLTQSAADVLPEDAANVGEAFQDALQTMPWAGDLSQEEIDQVLASVASELQTSDA